MTILLIEDMDSKYRELLRAARAGSNEIHPIYSTSWFYEELVEQPLEEAQNTLNSTSKSIEVSRIQSKSEALVESEQLDSVDSQSESKNLVTEKIKILDSLNVFSEEKLESKESFGFKGGEIKRKEGSAGHSNSIDFTNKNIQVLKSELEEELSIDGFKIKENSLGLLEKNNLKVFFVTDTYIRGEFSQDNLSALDLFFDSDVVLLFDRMIKAMKLTSDQYYISAISLNEKNKNEILLNEIYKAEPELIITLGAVATNFLTGDSERLKDIHGTMRNFNLKPEGDNPKNLKIMPLFSPTLLLTAPNMKKTAWKDMQKAMEFLGLS